MYIYTSTCMYISRTLKCCTGRTNENASFPINTLVFKLSQKYNHFNGKLAFSYLHTFQTYFMFISFYNFFEKLTHSKR